MSGEEREYVARRERTAAAPGAASRRRRDVTIEILPTESCENIGAVCTENFAILP